ncbi:hypothetical protein ABIA35_007443 [Catenulispora sp. MAP12-49]|uniref:hypothetical protein n=1 Tax=unclassified Catenulispora TaxID=414885 RepID=UPI003511E0C9
MNNRQPKASGASMDHNDSGEFDAGVAQDDLSAGGPAAAFHETADTADFPVDYEHSGDRRVDDALDRLAGLPDTPLPGHADVYDAVHTELRAILSEQPAGAQGPR